MDALTPGSPRRKELEALLVLDSLPGVGPRRARMLVGMAGAATRALASPRLLREGGGAQAAAAATEPARSRQAEEAVDRAVALGMSILLHTDEAYPRRLRQLADPPMVLFLRGRMELLARPGVAVVGARKATARARRVAHDLGAALAAAGRPVVSGLALGVDGAAHRGALRAGGPTIAVLGRGADQAYPPSHGGLFKEILADGLVVSEFTPGTPALPHHFPRRNRILAALSDTVVVVEAAARSGALITVDHALDLGVEVWAVPGPIQEPACEGSNALLTDGARPLVFVAGFLEAVAGERRGAHPAAESAGGPEPGGREGEILSVLAEGGCTADELARATGLAPGRVMALLAALEMEGRVDRMPGLRFRKAG